MRLLAEFRPIDEPVTFAGQPCYIDRFEVSDVAFANADSVVNFAVNNVDAAQQVVPLGPAIGVRSVKVTVTGRVYLTSVASVQAAGAAQADGRYGLPDLPFELSVPILGAMFDLSMAVSPAGVATLGLALQSLPGAELLGDAGAFLAGFQSLTLPFAVGSAFADVLAPGATRVLNAGVTHLDDGTVIRLEYEPEPAAPADTARRHNEWLRFFAGQVPSQLAGRAWAIDLPAQEMVNKAARELDSQFEGPEARKFFTSTGRARGEFVPDLPGIFCEKDGVLDSACGGLDIRATVETTVGLSVPAPNTLRTSGDIDLDLNDWDSAKCTVISLLNPFAGLITTFDKGAPWWAFVPISLALPLAPIAWGFGADDLVVRSIIHRESPGESGQEGPGDSANEPLDVLLRRPKVDHHRPDARLADFPGGPRVGRPPCADERLRRAGCQDAAAGSRETRRPIPILDPGPLLDGGVCRHRDDHARAGRPPARLDRHAATGTGPLRHRRRNGGRAAPARRPGDVADRR
jgi:hypothetical protein